MEKQSETDRWIEDRAVEHDDFSRTNDVALFMGAILNLYTDITAKELKILMERGEEFVLLDVRDNSSYDFEHICNSVNIPVSFIEGEAVKRLNPSDLIIVYGNSAESLESAVAADKLTTLSFVNVLRFIGGIAAWKDSGYCVEGRMEGFKEAA